MLIHKEENNGTNTEKSDAYSDKNIYIDEKDGHMLLMMKLN